MNAAVWQREARDLFHAGWPEEDVRKRLCGEVFQGRPFDGSVLNDLNDAIAAAKRQVELQRQELARQLGDQGAMVGLVGEEGPEAEELQPGQVIIAIDYERLVVVAIGMEGPHQCQIRMTPDEAMRFGQTIVRFSEEAKKAE